KPVLHVNSHVPALHVGEKLVFAVPQTVPQAPQFAGSVPTRVSQPFSGFASQSAKPSLQVTEHAPPVHEAAAFARAGQGSQLPAAQPTVGSSLETQRPPHVF